MEMATAATVLKDGGSECHTVRRRLGGGIGWVTMASGWLVTGLPAIGGDLLLLLANRIGKRASRVGEGKRREEKKSGRAAGWWRGRRRCTVSSYQEGERGSAVKRGWGRKKEGMGGGRRGKEGRGEAGWDGGWPMVALPVVGSAATASSRERGEKVSWVSWGRKINRVGVGLDGKHEFFFFCFLNSHSARVRSIKCKVDSKSS